MSFRSIYSTVSADLVQRKEKGRYLVKKCLFLTLLTLAHAGWAADWTWVDVGPEGGVMTTISVNPNGSSVISVSLWCDGYVTQGGPWQRSLLQGPSGEGAYCTFLLPDTAIFVAQEMAEVFRTVDGGLTWNPVWVFSDQVIGLSEVKSRVAYLVTKDEVNSVDNLYRTTDAGLTWSPLGSLPIYFEQDVSITSFLDTLIFVGSWVQDSTFVLKSDDGGLSWNTVVSFASQGDAGVYDLEWDESRKTLWTCFDPGPPHPASLPPVHLYNDSLGTAIFLDVLKDTGIYIIADLESPAQDTLLAGYLWGICRLVKTPQWDSVLLDSWVDSTTVTNDLDIDGGLMWAATNVGCMSSTDGGDTWQHQNTGLDAVTIYSRAQMSELVDQTLYSGSMGSVIFGPLYRSVDEGATWEWWEDGPRFSFLTELFGASPDVAYVHGMWLTSGFTYHSVARSTDAGASWTWMNSFPPDSFFAEVMVADLWVSASDQDVIVRTGGSPWQPLSGPVTRSTDGGASWSEVISENVSWLTGGDTVFASGESTWVSYDTGLTWGSFSDLGGPVDWDERNQYLYLVSMTDSIRLYRYDLAGGSTLVFGPLYSVVPIPPDVSVSPQGHVYFSWFDADWYPAIARSTNLGATWEIDTLDFLCTMVKACSTGVLAGEVGRGLKRSTDIVGVEEGEATLPPKVSFTVSPNPFVKSATVKYPASRKGKGRVAVYDVTGRLVQVIAEGRREEGAYRASWDGRNMHGKEASAGIYFIRLEAEGDEARTLSLVKLPN